MSEDENARQVVGIIEQRRVGDGPDRVKQRGGEQQQGGEAKGSQIEDFRVQMSDFRWCERGDLNPHGFPRQILSLVRLPIPPLSHSH